MVLHAGEPDHPTHITAVSKGPSAEPITDADAYLLQLISQINPVNTPGFQALTKHARGHLAGQFELWSAFQFQCLQEEQRRWQSWQETHRDELQQVRNGGCPYSTHGMGRGTSRERGRR